MNLALLVIAIQVLVSLYATYDIAVSLQKVTGVIWGMAVFFALVRFGKKRIGIFITTLIFILEVWEFPFWAVGYRMANQQNHYFQFSI